MDQQINTFKELFPYISPEGIYLCEDIHTSYWLRYGGGHKRSGSFIEFTKNFIDALNAYHSEQRSLKVDDFTKSVDSIHYYDSIVVVEKKQRVPPIHEATGNRTFPRADDGTSRTFPQKIKHFIIKWINKLLQALRIRSFIWR